MAGYVYNGHVPSCCVQITICLKNQFAQTQPKYENCAKITHFNNKYNSPIIYFNIKIVP